MSEKSVNEINEQCPVLALKRRTEVVTKHPEAEMQAMLEQCSITERN